MRHSKNDTTAKSGLLGIGNFGVSGTFSATVAALFLFPIELRKSFTPFLVGGFLAVACSVTGYLML